MFLAKNTAGQTVGFGLVNSSTGAALTGATVSVRRCIDGTFAATTGTVTEDSGGLYKFAPSQADTNGDQITYYFTATSAIPLCLNLRTTAADMADAVRFGLTALPNAAANANGGLPILSSSGTTLAYTVSTLTTYTGNTPQTGDAFARIGATGSGLTSLAPSATALSTAVWTAPPTGFLAATFPATVASTTNITAGTITTVTTLTNLPTIPANWLTAAGIAANALNGKGDWLLSSGYTAPDNAGISSISTTVDDISTKVDSLTSLPAAGGDLPTAAQNASEVRTNLTTELGRIDAAVSSRMATYTQPAGFLAATFPSDPADQSLVIAATDALLAAVNLRATQASVDVIDGIVDLILADTGTDGVVLSAAQMNKVADHVRRRTQANVEASSDGDTLSLGSEYGMIQMAQESDADTTPGTLTVYRTDGTTVLGTKTLTSDATADPITRVQ